MAIPFTALNLAVLTLAGYLIIGAVIHIRQVDRQIEQHKKSQSLELEE